MLPDCWLLGVDGVDPKQVRPMVRTRKCSCMECFYCWTSLDDRHEHDHFPVPKVAGGTSVVSACLDCHDLKDRILFEKWPIQACLEAVQGLFNDVHPPEDKRMPTGDLCRWLSTQSSLRDAAILDRWADLPALSRILYGKARSMEEEHRYRQGQQDAVGSDASTVAELTERGIAAWAETYGCDGRRQLQNLRLA